ncbi:hypothetical protein BS47DRAFT_1359418 [Hydnum rufescens UP504]|uniref:Uncharacterized protein n=1 Tax=Hydnum rufescens UP504 TaxID=1448309 RepID=A0A9P6B513_9AGAM|nr:hypothetical protein BS47DRAFT_1359418 [Hydnum rufescens UP504]
MWFNSFSTLAILAVSLLNFTPTEAIITGVSAPKSTLHPGHTFNVTFFTENHIINNAQYYALFGVTPSTKPDQVMGILLNEGFDLVTSGHSQTGHGSFPVTLAIPPGFVTETGKTQAYILNTAVFGTLHTWNQNTPRCPNTILAMLPILNPFEQLPAPAFDAFVVDVTTAIRNALNPPVAPIPPRAAARIPGIESSTPDRSTVFSPNPTSPDVGVDEIDNSDEEEEVGSVDLDALSCASLSSGPSQPEGYSNLSSGSSASGDKADLDHKDTPQWILDDEEGPAEGEEQGEEQEQEEEEQEEQEDEDNGSADDSFVRQRSIGSDSNISVPPPKSSTNAKGKARAIDEGPGVQALQGISERLHAHPELFASQSSSEDGDEYEDLGSYGENEEQGGENEDYYVRQHSSEYSDRSGSLNWNQGDEDRIFSGEEPDSSDNSPLRSLGDDPDQPIELSDSEADESKHPYSPDQMIFEGEQSNDVAAPASQDHANSRVAAQASQAVAYTHLVADYNDADEESESDSSVRDENASPYAKQDWSGNGLLRGTETTDFAFPSMINDYDDEDEDVDFSDTVNGYKGQGAISVSDHILNGRPAGDQAEYRSPTARVGEISIIHALELLRAPIDQGTENGEVSQHVGFPDPNLPPPPTELITPHIEHDSRPIFEGTSTSNIAQPSATPALSEKPIQSFPGISFDADETSIPSFDMFHASDQQIQSRSSSPENGIFDPETPGEPGESLIEDIYVASHGYDESTPSTLPDTDLVLASPRPSTRAHLIPRGQDHNQQAPSKPPPSAAAGVMYSTAIAVDEPAISSLIPQIVSHDDREQLSPEDMVEEGYSGDGTRAVDDPRDSDFSLDVMDASAAPLSVPPVSAMPDDFSGEPGIPHSPSESSSDFFMRTQPTDPAPIALLSAPLAMHPSNGQVNNALSLDVSVTRSVSPASSLRSHPSASTPQSSFSANAPSLDKLAPDASSSPTSIGPWVTAIVPKEASAEILDPTHGMNGVVTFDKDITDGEEPGNGNSVVEAVEPSSHGVSDVDTDNMASRCERSPHNAASESGSGTTDDQERRQPEPDSAEAASILSDDRPTPRPTSLLSLHAEIDDFIDDASSQSGGRAIGDVVHDASSAFSSSRGGTPTARKRKRKTSLLVDQGSPALNTRSRTKGSSDHIGDQDSRPGSPSSTTSWASDTSRLMKLAGRQGAGQQQRTQRDSSVASAASIAAASQESSPRPYVLLSRPHIHHHRTASTPGVSGSNRAAPNSLVTSHVTRSQCRFHKISAPGLIPGEVVHFVVPYCSLSATDVMKEEGIIDCGIASDADNRNKVTDVSHLDTTLASVLRKLVGPDLMHEEVCATRRGHKRKLSRLRLGLRDALDEDAGDDDPIAGSSTTPSEKGSHSVADYQSSGRGSTGQTAWSKTVAQTESSIRCPVEDEDGTHESEAEEYRDTPPVSSSEFGTPPPVVPSSTSKHSSKRKRRVRDSGALLYKPGSDESDHDGSGSDTILRPKPKRRRQRLSTVARLKENGFRGIERLSLNQC